MNAIFYRYLSRDDVTVLCKMLVYEQNFGGSKYLDFSDFEIKVMSTIYQEPRMLLYSSEAIINVQ